LSDYGLRQAERTITTARDSTSCDDRLSSSHTTGAFERTVWNV
jgi:hypothetical protein